MIALHLDERTETLRRDFLSWLRSNPPPEIVEQVDMEEYLEVSLSWQKALARDRWIAVHWPEEYGGRGLSMVEEAVIQEILAQVRAPQLVSLFGINVVGSLLIKCGSEEQRRRYLPPLREGEELWCQGFSEPQAGTDLASLQTAARKVENGWEISGSKSWVSYAQFAHWCLCLIRTDPDLPKHDGLSCFMVPLQEPGISVEPLEHMSGDREFSSIRLDGVFVPEGSMLGERGAGWELALHALGFRQAVMSLALHAETQFVLAEIRRILRSRPCTGAEVRDFGRLAAEHMAGRALTLSRILSGDTDKTHFQGILDRLSWSENYQRVCRLALEIQGLEGVAAVGLEHERSGILQHRYLSSRGATIAAGTSEIQRNLIAERILGLPRGG